MARRFSRLLSKLFADSNFSLKDLSHLTSRAPRFFVYDILVPQQIAHIYTNYFFLSIPFNAYIYRVTSIYNDGIMYC